MGALIGDCLIIRPLKVKSLEIDVAPEGTVAPQSQNEAQYLWRQFSALLSGTAKRDNPDPSC